jgi:hypothetical protein
MMSRSLSTLLALTACVSTPSPADVPEVTISDASAPEVVDVSAPDVVDVPPTDTGPITQSTAAGESCGNAPAMNSNLGIWRYAGSTARRSDDHRGSCASGNGQGDVAWRLVLPAARRVTLTARPSGSWSPLLAVSRDNCDRRTEELTSGVMERESSCSTGAAGSEVTV